MTIRASSLRKAIQAGAAGTDRSKRFVIEGHPYRLRYFAKGTHEAPPPGTIAIPSEDGEGVFWIMPETIRLMPSDSSSF